MEARKRKKYVEECRSANLIFCLFAIESYGATTDIATNYILDPIQGIKDFTPINWTARTTKSFWYQRLSLTPLWASNAKKVKSCLNDF